MSELRFDAVNHGPLADVTASFRAGSHVVLGSERDGTDSLVMLAAGLTKPSAGHVTLSGVAAWSNAGTRRRVASLCADETALPGRDVTSALALALRARGDARSALSVLDAAGLAGFATHRVSTLTRREARAVALSIALSHPSPTLVALHEPLGLLGLISEGFVLQSVGRFTERGAIVLCTACRLEDAARLGGSLSSLERGSWLGVGLARVPLAPITLRVHTPDPRRLAARLAEAPEIAAVEWTGGQELLVRGTELERVAHAVVLNARAEAISITALKQDLPALEPLAAARAGLYQREQKPPSAGQP
jgi:ABC-type taurine transport system ATPase subunit